MALAGKPKSDPPSSAFRISPSRINSDDVRHVLSLKYSDLSLEGSIQTVNSRSTGRTDRQRQIDTAMMTRAWEFMHEEYRGAIEQGKCREFRKDGVTPTQSHPIHLATLLALFGIPRGVIISYLHDLPEDCGTKFMKISGGKTSDGFGGQTALSVASLTHPKLIDPKTPLGTWKFATEGYDGFETAIDLFQSRKELYELRLMYQYLVLINNPDLRLTPEMKALSYLVKMCDSLLNLSTDSALDPIRAEIRAKALAYHSRHLAPLSPSTYNVIIELLKDHGMIVNPHGFVRPQLPKGGVVIVPDINEFDSAFCDALRMPEEKAIEVCTGSGEIRIDLNAGKNIRAIRIHFPHDAPEDLIERLRHYISKARLRTRIRTGRSILPVAGDGASAVVMIEGIPDMPSHEKMIQVLQRIRKDVWHLDD